MAKTLRIVVENRLPEIRRLSAAVEDFCEEAALAPRLVFNLTMALDELLTNTISYGYETEARGAITVEISLGEDALVTELRDDARGFNPLEDAPKPDLDLGLEDRQIGGLGVHLVKSMVDAVAYRREGGQNVITLTQRFAPAAS